MDKPVTFDWDENNESHLAIHAVSREEFEEMFESPRVEVEQQKRNGEQRFLVFGRTATGRPLTAVYTIRQGRIRAVTAYTTKRNNRGLYEQSIEKQD